MAFCASVLAVSEADFAISEIWRLADASVRWMEVSASALTSLTLFHKNAAAMPTTMVIARSESLTSLSKYAISRSYSVFAGSGAGCRVVSGGVDMDSFASLQLVVASCPRGTNRYMVSECTV